MGNAPEREETSPDEAKNLEIFPHGNIPAGEWCYLWSNECWHRVLVLGFAWNSNTEGDIYRVCQPGGFGPMHYPQSKLISEARYASMLLLV